jgi:hypothetical protein
MKKLVFVLLAIGGLSGVSIVTIETLRASEMDASVAARKELLLMERAEGNPVPEAICKEVEISLDEGYGVSRVEKRSVCQDPH